MSFQMSLSPSSFQQISPRLKVYYKIGDSKKFTKYKNEAIPLVSDDIQVMSNFSPHVHHEGSCIATFTIKAFKKVEINQFQLSFATQIQEQRMLANGFQSWSQAREFSKNDKIPAIRPSVAWYTQLNLQGDYDIFQHSGEKGLIHSSSYTHFRDVHNIISFFGSISEQHGYTYFIGDFNNNQLRIYKDVIGLNMEPGQEIELVKVFIAQGHNAEASIWDSFAEFYPDRRSIHKDKRHVNGWTSWYNYYSDVSEKIICDNVDALKQFQYPIDIFQIDDGFQTAVGDWLSINSKFPNGMKYVADRIKQAGFKPGLWLAPYAAGFNSRLAKDHPEWLITDPETKKPVVAGPNWGGFYGINIYHPQVRIYLQKVFDTVLIEWGFDMVKLDFCFAAAMIPFHGRSRGQIMWESMELIRDLVGSEKLILGCGVPLASAFKKVDYCRIGSDVAPWWEDGKLKRLHVRERVSTANSLVSTLSRWAMSDRMFGNDPDVMILRNSKNKLTLHERYTLCVLNNILGSLVFSSDNVYLYSKQEHLLYAATFPKVEPFVKSVLEFRKNCFIIRFTVKHTFGCCSYTTYSNLTSEEQTVYLPESSKETHILSAVDMDMHIAQSNQSKVVFYHPSSDIKLKTHETKTFLHIPKNDGLSFLGGVGHIVPGVDVDTLERKGEEIRVKFRKENSRRHKICFALGEYLFNKRCSEPPVCRFNGYLIKHDWVSVKGSGEGREKSEVLLFCLEEY